MIEVVAVGGMDRGILNYISSEVENLFAPCRVSEAILEPPEEAYSEERGQYLSSPLLQSLLAYSRGSKADLILGITEVDIYAKGTNFIFGQAQANDRCCLVSLHRLDPAFYGEHDLELYRERAVKEAVHELGHCLGLSHCQDPSCVMVFSNSIAEVDKKTMHFCRRCGPSVGRG